MAPCSKKNATRRNLLNKLDRSYNKPRNPTVFFPEEDTMKVVPLNDKLVVKRLEAEEKTAGGILLPDSAKEKPKQGKILSLGDGKLLENGKRASFQVKEGDRVLFSAYAGNEVNVDGEEYLIMSEDDILAVLD
jgi:chaperonin GroES